MRTPHIVVDEQRWSLMANSSLKSMDFIVYAPDRNLLVDVKGRKFPFGAETNGHKWENWATEDDLESLLRWQSVFGNDFARCWCLPIMWSIRAGWANSRIRSSSVKERMPFWRLGRGILSADAGPLGELGNGLASEPSLPGTSPANF
jgi:hypothetical protein